MRGNGEDDQLAGGTGVHNQPSKIADHSNTEDPVSGIPSGLQPNEAVPPAGEGSEDCSELPVADETTNSYNSPTIPITGKDDCSSSSSSVSTNTVPLPSALEDSHSES